MFQECDIAHLISIYTYIQGNKPLALLCTGDVIAILTLATVVIFLSLLIKPFFLKQKPPKQHFKMLFLIRFGNIWSIKIFQNF